MGLRRSPNIRGLKDIRTHSSKVDVAGVPYLAYMKISCLEMEKVRQENERNSVISRMKEIDSRIIDIDVEKDIILKELSEHQEINNSCVITNYENCSKNRNMRGGLTVKSILSNKNKDGFKIKY